MKKGNYIFLQESNFLRMSGTEEVERRVAIDGSLKRRKGEKGVREDGKRKGGFFILKNRIISW